MFQKVLRYTGRHRKTTYASILVLVAGVAMSVLPYFFLYRLLRPLLTGGSLTLEETLLNAGAMALCMVLYGLLYVEGLALSHRSAYHTLENLRLHLQSKLEKQPLGAIQEKGVGVWKKMFIDDIESMELLLAHALPEGLSNLAVPVVVFVAMFLTDWKLGLLSPLLPPAGRAGYGHDVPLRHEQDGRLLRRRAENEQHHRGVHQRHGSRESLQPGRRVLSPL